MIKAKKIVSLVLSIVMLISCFTVSAFALADGKTVGVKLVADKATVNPGDTVTYTMYLDCASNIALLQLAFSYNTNVFEAPTAAGDLNAKFLGDLAGYAVEQSPSVAATIHNNYAANMATTGENSLYNASFAQNFRADSTNKGADSKVGFAVTSADTAQYSFQLKVKDSVAPGTAANVALTKGAMMTTNRCSIKLANGGTGTLVAVDALDLSGATATSTVAAAASILKPLKGQMRYGTPDAEGNKTYDVRALAAISKDDFEAKFTADKATAESMIKEVGFVFAAGSSIEAPSIDAVKALVQNGTAVAGYEKKQVYTISTSIDAENDNYVLSCIVKDISEDDAKTNKLIAVAYIVYTDAEGATQYIYYDAAQTIEFKPLFDLAK